MGVSRTVYNINDLSGKSQDFPILCVFNAPSDGSRWSWVTLDGFKKLE